VSKVTFKTMPVVFVSVRGEKEDEASLSSGRKDGGLVTRLLSFMVDQNIITAVRGGLIMGGGVFRGFYTAEDAERIEAWLIEQDVEREE